MRFDAFALQRIGHWFYKKRIPLLPHCVDLLIFLLFNSSISHRTVIGKGSKCAYRGMSVLIHERAIIGKNVTVGAHVVIGGRVGYNVPVIEDDVFISPNACVMGDVTIGQGSIIGAGAVVVNSCPPNSKLVAPKAQSL
jgi:serine O-acetyltransferase